MVIQQTLECLQKWTETNLHLFLMTFMQGVVLALTFYCVNFPHTRSEDSRQLPPWW